MSTFEALAAKLSERLEPGDLAAITIDVTDADPVRPSAPWRTYLSVPARANEPAYRLESEGAAETLEASGPNRFLSIRGQARRLFGKLKEFHVGDTGLPTARLIGGFGFEDDGGLESPWDTFPSASFALPRWTWGTYGEGRRFLRLAFRVGEDFESAADSEEPPLPPEPIPVQVRAYDDGFPGRVREALAAIAEGAVRKVVLSRRLELTREQLFSAREFLARAEEPDSARFVFERGEYAFVGQTPERLVRLHKGYATSDALAGTAPASADPATLLTSDKDLREHALVVDRLRATLANYGETFAASRPRIRAFRTVQHLATSVMCRLARPVHVLELASVLHPTPALGGEPREEALALLRRLEGNARGWYGGLVGWFDSEGQGELWVAIRSALLREQRAWVFAGAGIVEGSSPADELSETANKAASILHALGVV